MDVSISGSHNASGVRELRVAVQEGEGGAFHCMWGEWTMIRVVGALHYISIHYKGAETMGFSTMVRVSRRYLGAAISPDRVLVMGKGSNRFGLGEAVNPSICITARAAIHDSVLWRAVRSWG